MKIEQAEEEEGGAMGTGKNQAATETGRGRPIKCRRVKAVTVGPRLLRLPCIRLIVSKRSEVKFVTNFAHGDGGDSNTARKMSRTREKGKTRSE